jgi:hypothetical protein
VFAVMLLAAVAALFGAAARQPSGARQPDTRPVGSVAGSGGRAGRRKTPFT